MQSISWTDAMVSLSHKYIRTQKHTHTQTHKDTNAYTHMHAYALADRNTDERRNVHTHTYTHARTLKHANTQIHTHMSECKWASWSCCRTIQILKIWSQINIPSNFYFAILEKRHCKMANSNTILSSHRRKINFCSAANYYACWMATRFWSKLRLPVLQRLGWAMNGSERNSVFPERRSSVSHGLFPKCLCL